MQISTIFMKRERITIKLDFNLDIDFKSKINYLVYFRDEKIIFTKYKKYKGPITLQLLPYGGIQSLNRNKIIVALKNGYLEVSELIYKDEEMTSKDFINLVGRDELLNAILK